MDEPERSGDSLPFYNFKSRQKSFRKGQDYVSIASDPVEGRVLEVSEGRDTVAAVEVLEKALPEELRASVAAVIADFWQPYSMAAAKVFPGADLVHDRFPISKYLHEALDKVRRQEAKALRTQGDDTLTGQRWLFLSSPEEWSREQKAAFARMEAQELKTSRAWMFKELFRHFWTCRSRSRAEKFFDDWWRKAKRSKLEPVKEVAD